MSRLIEIISYSIFSSKTWHVVVPSYDFISWFFLTSLKITLIDFSNVKRCLNVIEFDRLSLCGIWKFLIRFESYVFNDFLRNSLWIDTTYCSFVDKVIRSEALNSINTITFNFHNLKIDILKWILNYSTCSTFSIQGIVIRQWTTSVRSIYKLKM